jgi:hypothetical protein
LICSPRKNCNSAIMLISNSWLISSANLATRELHYVKTSNRSHNICNGPLTPVTCTLICNDCYFAPVTDKCGRSTLGLASETPVTNVDFW